MPRPAGLHPKAWVHTPEALQAVVLSAVHQSSGNHSSGWSRMVEIKRVLLLRGERAAAGLCDTEVQVLVSMGRVESRSTLSETLYRLSHQN